MRSPVALLTAAEVAVGLGIALACLTGSLSAGVAVISLLAGIAAGVVAFRQTRPPGAPARVSPVEWVVIGVFTLASLRAFLWLIYPDGDQILVLSVNNLGDLPLHLGFIRYFASGVPFWPESPIFTGVPLTYPIGVDFLNSLLLRVGLPVEQGVVWVGLAGSALTLAALWRWGRGFAIAAFLFGGGLAGFVIFRELFAGKIPAIEDFQGAEQWKNPFLALFVTQRGFLMALPAGLFLLDDWRSRFLRRETPLLPWWVALLLYATMPLYSIHSFLYLSIALLGIFAFAAGPEARSDCLKFVAAAFLPAAVCGAVVTDLFSVSGGIHLAPGWMQNEAPAGEEPPHPVWFWLNNFGLYLVLWAGLAVYSAIKGPRETRALVLPATVMFLVCTVVSFAVWPWDNTKIFIWCWLAVAPCLWNDVIRPSPLPSRIVACFVLFFTGAVSLVAGLDGRNGYGVFKRTQVWEAQAVVDDLPADARFACAPEYWHPLLVLGRKLALGYDGHLWSHGMNYRPMMRELDNLMNGGPGWRESAEKLDVDYLVWSDAERKRYPSSTRDWATKLPIVAQGERITVYSLKP